MAAFYAKVYEGFFTGTIRERHPTVRLLFLALISRCDEDGVVTGTDSFLAQYTNISAKDYDKALSELMEKDPESTTPDQEGRRVIRLGPNRLHVVNYRQYYDLGRKISGESSAMTAAERQAKRRARIAEEAKNATQNACVTVSRDVTTKRKEKKRKETLSNAVRQAHGALVEEFFALYPRPLPREGSSRARDIGLGRGTVVLLALLKKGEDGKAILDGVAGYRDFIMGNYPKEGPFVKGSEAWLNGRLWEEYRTEPKPEPVAMSPDAPIYSGDPIEGVDYETREVPHLYRSRNEWGVAEFNYIPGTNDLFDLREWRAAKGAAQARNSLDL